jgi:branched-chain amino acid transport system ATP-binding protein
VSDNLLEIVALRKEFGGLIAVNDVDLTIPRGGIVALIGPNGAGKTTFFNMITGVYKPTSGSVVFDGKDIAGSPPHTATERGIGRTFQNIRLFQQMTSLENVLVGSLAEGHPWEHPGHAPGEARGAPPGAAHELLACAPRRRGRLRATSRTTNAGSSRLCPGDATEALADEPTAGMNPQESAEFTAFIRSATGRADRAAHRDDMKVVRASRAVDRARLRREDRRGTPKEVQSILV